MSAPPMGSVISTPSASESTKNAMIHGIASVVSAITPQTTDASATSALNHCCPGKVYRLSMRPSSLAQAMTEPVSDTAPISAPMTASDSVNVEGAGSPAE